MSRVAIQSADFDVGERYRKLLETDAAASGAVVVFVGLVRDRNAKAGDGAEVASLTLEHYPGMTEKSIERIIAQAEDRWPLTAVQVVHRVGTLLPGDQIVGVFVASAHRDAAFDAGSFLMDYLKTDAVFWKKEITEVGERWIESVDDDRVRRQAWGVGMDDERSEQRQRGSGQDGE